MSIGIFPESLSQAILVGRILVGRLGVPFTSYHEQISSGHKILNDLGPKKRKLRDFPLQGIACIRDVPRLGISLSKGFPSIMDVPLYGQFS